MTWIGVDLDGTLAHYDGWKGPEHIGPPIAPMVDRVRGWLAEGLEVRVFTSRMSNRRDTVQAVREHLAFVRALELWCVEHIGQPLRATCLKDDGMVELWDDRAVGVEFNTGAVRDGVRPVRI